MKAVRIHRYGGPEVLKYEEVPLPTPGAGEVLVRVHAAGVNPIDWKIREGHLKQYSLPLILGWDVSGTVEATGAGVSEWKKGDPVYALADITRDGAYAEYIVVRASEVARMPVTVDHIEAAAIPMAALTAWQALFDIAELDARQKVLIHGAAGGVGIFALQLAKWKRAQVIGTASARNQHFLRELGADDTIDYHKIHFEDVVPVVDVVLDLVGNDTQERSWRVLKQGGVLVSSVTRPSEKRAAERGVRTEQIVVQPNAEQLGQIARLVEMEKLRPIIQTALPLSEARQGQAMSQAGHVRGKIVLRVD